MNKMDPKWHNVLLTQHPAFEKADWRDVDLAHGHPRVKSSVVGDHAICRARLSTFIGWLWLFGTGMALVVSFTGLAQGGTYVMGERVPHPNFRHFLVLGTFLALFSLPGWTFSVATCAVTLTPDLVTVRWRVLPYCGWTWTLPVGNEARVFLVRSGFSENNKPVLAVVIASQGREISFGSFLPYDLKEFLGAAIHDYHNGAELVRTSTANSPRSGRWGGGR